MSRAGPMSETAPKSTISLVGTSRGDCALRSVRAHLWLWAVAAVGLSADLVTKSIAFQRLGVDETRELVPSVLSLRLSLNPGALFGMGAGKVPLFIVASVVALGFVLYLFAGSGRRQRGVHLALAMILAGALGNLYDRAFVRRDLVHFKPASGVPAHEVGHILDDTGSAVIVFRHWGHAQGAEIIRRENVESLVRNVGVVRDFLKITPVVAGREIWPWVFNVADVLLVAGVSLLLISYSLEMRRALRPAAAESPQSPSVS